MISQEKIAANRSNGRKSRGPRTAAGKASASRNALRHGLAAITQRNAALFPEIEPMAKALCADDKNPFLFEQALTIAENQLVLHCVRAERVAMIERLRDQTATPLRRDKSLARAKARFRQAKLTYKHRVQAKAGNSVENSAGNSTSNTAAKEDLTRKRQEAATRDGWPSKTTGLRDEFDAMQCAMPDLDRLERYERRAWSRRKRAIRSFIEIKARS
jgi:hypothetical protein